jgi:hypothetical protein
LEEFGHHGLEIEGQVLLDLEEVVIRNDGALVGDQVPPSYDLGVFNLG